MIFNDTDILIKSSNEDLNIFCFIDIFPSLYLSIFFDIIYNNKVIANPIHELLDCVAYKFIKINT